MNLKTTLILCLLLVSVRVSAQESVKDSLKSNTLSEVNEVAGMFRINFHDEGLSNYLILMDSIDRKTLVQEGFRIQLFSKSGPGARELAYKQQSEFLSAHRNYSTYVKWNSPNWVLRIGDYRTRLEATKYREELKLKYPASFIINDEIISEY